MSKFKVGDKVVFTDEVKVRGRVNRGFHMMDGNRNAVMSVIGANDDYVDIVCEANGIGEKESHSFDDSDLRLADENAHQLEILEAEVSRAQEAMKKMMEQIELLKNPPKKLEKWEVIRQQLLAVPGLEKLSEFDPTEVDSVKDGELIIVYDYSGRFDPNFKSCYNKAEFMTEPYDQRLRIFQWNESEQKIREMVVVKTLEPKE